MTDRLVNTTTAGARVYPSRAVSLHADLLPCILVYFRSETSGRFSESPRIDRRRPQLAVEFVDKIGDPVSLDDRLDAAAAEIEHQIYSDEQLGGNVADLDLSETEWDHQPAGEVPFGAVRLTFELDRYQRRLTDADLAALTDKFERAHVDYETTKGAAASDVVEPEQ